MYFTLMTSIKIVTLIKKVVIIVISEESKKGISLFEEDPCFVYTKLPSFNHYTLHIKIDANVKTFQFLSLYV